MRRPSSGLTVKGVNYDVGIPWAPGFDSRSVWRPDLVRAELQLVRDGLRCNSVLLYGSVLERFVECGRFARELGLQVWLSPRLIDGTQAETLSCFGEAARIAEQLRSEGTAVTLLLGCELTVFMAGLVPGAGFEDRAKALEQAGAEGFDVRLGEFLARARSTVRPLFSGPLSYSAGLWETVDWSDFDVVASNLYRYSGNEATYAADVRRLRSSGKPAVVTEVGCATWRGAASAGPMGHEAIDWSGERPRISPGHVRDEQEQATYLDQALDVLEAEGAHGAFAFELISPSKPHAAEAEYDLDLASYALLKVYGPEAERGYATGHSERKLAFDVVARHWAR
ncbi:MAG: hypothetical protein JNK82_32340 [Myxococcaceae bacterium]|nr:hypothetical protein [Myxococcaceae bacterium]